MKKTRIMSGLLAVAFVLAAVGTAYTAEAAPNGNAWGYWGNPGNSAFGRSHNKHYVAPGFWWAGSHFEDMDALIEYLRDYILRLQDIQDEDDEDAEIDITTRSAVNIEEDGATLRGSVDFEHSDSATVWFEYGETSSNLNEDTSKVELDDGDSRYFSRNIDDLEENERYYFRAVGEDEDGEKDYGAVRSFTTDDTATDDSEVNITTRSATDIEHDRATLRGEIDFNSSDWAYVWFEYGETFSNLDEDTSRVRLEDTDDELFEREVDDLKDDERYYFRAVGEDEDGEKNYGSIRSFTTDEDDELDEPTVTTHQAHEVTDDSVELNGEVDMNDFRNGIVFFVYGTDEEQIGDVANEYDTYAEIDEDGDNLQKIRVDTDLDGDSTFSPDVDNLDPDTTYYYVIGVQYEDADDDDVLLIGDVEDFVTDNQ